MPAEDIVTELFAAQWFLKQLFALLSGVVISSLVFGGQDSKFLTNKELDHVCWSYSVDHIAFAYVSQKNKNSFCGFNTHIEIIKRLVYSTIIDFPLISKTLCRQLFNVNIQCRSLEQLIYSKRSLFTVM